MAAGPWSAALLAPLGVALHLAPRPLQMLLTDGAPRAVVRQDSVAGSLATAREVYPPLTGRVVVKAAPEPAGTS